MLLIDEQPQGSVIWMASAESIMRSAQTIRATGQEILAHRRKDESMKINLPLSTIAIFIIFSGSPLYGDTIPGSESETVKHNTTPVQQSSFLTGDSQKVVFDFDKMNEFTGWLRDNGEWSVAGWVKHNHLHCSTYRMGIRFGKGSPACVNVKWLTEPVYVTRKKQCNQANMYHKGSDSNPALAEIFKEITCADAMVRCTGVCD